MEIDDNVRSSVTGWVGKAAAGVDDTSLAHELSEIHDHLIRAIDELKSEKYPDAVRGLGKAHDKLESLEDDSRWNGSNYHRCIYDGGDGGGYESGYYKKANKAVNGYEITDTLDAIEYLKQRAYEESPTLSR